MNRIPQAFIDELLNRTDIVEIVDSRVKLKKSGKNYSACCPFHNEKTPSFTVSPDKQFYYCFGCGASGTAINFVMEFDRLNFVDTIELFAKKHSLSIPQETGHNRRQDSFSKDLYSLLDNTKTFYQSQLHEHSQSSPARRYLNERGLSTEIIQSYQLGYAPPGWNNLLTKLGVTTKDRQLLIDSGMVVLNEDKQKQYDRFRHRIMYPIIDIRGRTIGFGGRVLDIEPSTGPNHIDQKPGPKYLNSPETPVFHKSRELYGLFQARQANRKLDQLIVVEGYMDVIALAQFGVTYAVATLGTACGEEHLRLAFRYTHTVIFCFDGDNAGRKAARRALESCLPVMSDGVRIKFLFLPEGQDPDTMVRKIGAERFELQIKQAISLEEFLFDAAGEGINSQTMEGKASLSKAVAPLIHKLPKGVYRELMFDHLAKRTSLSRDVLMELIEAEPKLPTEQPTSTALASSSQLPAIETQAPLPTTPHTRRDAPVWQPGTAALAQHSKRTKLSPVRMAIAVLLDSPGVLQTLPDLSLPDKLNDPDVKHLRKLIEYLQTRPHVTFPNIIGYWLGHYGNKAQRELLELAATELLSDAQRMTPIDKQTELQGAFNRLREDAIRLSIDEELAKLQAIEFAHMTAEQKKRFKKLLLSQQQ